MIAKKERPTRPASWEPPVCPECGVTVEQTPTGTANGELRCYCNLCGCMFVTVYRVKAEQTKYEFCY